MDDQDRRYLDLKFSTLEDKLDSVCKKFDDHEGRLRAIEKQQPWQWVAQAIAGIAAAAGIGTGFKN